MLPGSPMFIFLCAFFILNFVPVSIKFALLYWQQNILYFLTEKYSNQIYLISTVNSKPNRFLQLHYKIHFSDPPPAFSTNQKGLVHVDVFCWVSRHFRGTWLRLLSLWQWFHTCITPSFKLHLLFSTAIKRVILHQSLYRLSHAFSESLEEIMSKYELCWPTEAITLKLTLPQPLQALQFLK